MSHLFLVWYIRVYVKYSHYGLSFSEGHHHLPSRNSTPIFDQYCKYLRWKFNFLTTSGDVRSVNMSTILVYALRSVYNVVMKNVALASIMYRSVTPPLPNTMAILIRSTRPTPGTSQFHHPQTLHLLETSRSTMSTITSIPLQRTVITTISTTTTTNMTSKLRALNRILTQPLLLVMCQIITHQI